MNPTDFPAARMGAYLDTAAEGLPPLAVTAAMEEYLREKSRGSAGRARHYERQTEAEAGAAALLGARPDDLVLLANASEALNLLAASIDWREGDEVLLYDLEFPSNVVTWLALRQRGVRVVVVPTHDGETTLSDWTSRMTPRTRLVTVSQVSYLSGTQIPFVRELAAEARRAGAIFCLDATQAMGRVPVSVEGVDFLVASTYKWLLGTHGLGVTYISPELRERLPAPTAGWYAAASLFHPERFSVYTPKASAGRMQTGMPNFPAIYALNASLQYLRAQGVEQIDASLRPLMAHLRQSLAGRGFSLLTPSQEKFASGIVSFRDATPEATTAHLASKGVTVWGGDGRVRISVHLYNDDGDIAGLLDALDGQGG